MCDMEEEYECEYEDEDEEEYQYDSDDNDSDAGGGETPMDTSMVDADDATSSTPSIKTDADVLAKVQREARELSEILCISLPASKAVLAHCDWSSNRAQEKWFGDMESLLQAIGLVGLQAGAQAPVPPLAAGYSCPICMDDIESADAVFALPCGHFFCNECWRNGLSAEIRNEGQNCIKMRCMHGGCNEAVTEDVFTKFLAPDATSDSQSLMDVYNERVVAAYVEKNKAYKPCPEPGCSKYAYFRDDGFCDDRKETDLPLVSCDCGREWCFRCGEEAHQPVSCARVKVWNSKADDSDRTQLYIKANTKNCPGCDVQIFQDGGCLHMTCQKCRCHFCWLCGATPFHSKAVGGYYKCNKFEERVRTVGLSEEERKQVINLLDRQAIAQQLLKKYNDSYQRFLHHHSGRDAVREMLQGRRGVVKKHGPKLLERGLIPALSDMQFIMQALDELIKCRQVLAWSYVHKHHEFIEELDETRVERRKRELDLFENAQGLLETYSEDLQQLIEPAAGAQHLDMRGGGAGGDSGSFFSRRMDGGGGGGHSRGAGAGMDMDMGMGVGLGKEEMAVITAGLQGFAMAYPGHGVGQWKEFRAMVQGKHKAIKQFRSNLIRDMAEGFAELREEIDLGWLREKEKEMAAAKQWLECENLNEFGDAPDTKYHTPTGHPILPEVASLQRWNPHNEDSPLLPDWIPKLEHLCRKHPEGKPWKRFMVQSPMGKDRVAQWAWQDDAGVWNPYSDENISKVEEAFAKETKGSVEIMCSRQLYRVDFRTMSQRNLSNHGVRHVRRAMVSADSDWTCPHCTYHNSDGQSRVCMMCQQPR